MRCLWITRVVPYPPFFGGDAQYSSGLIESLAAAGADVTVVTSSIGETEAPLIPSVRWITVQSSDRMRLLSLASKWPAIVYRASTPELRRAARRLISSEAWDVVVADNFAVAGVLEDLPTRDGQGVPVAYVSHNHETSLRESLAARVSPWSPWRVIQALDAMKAASIEAALVRRAGLITATSAADVAEFRRDAPHTSLVELRPGFGGRRVERRTIDERVPRRVLYLGTFNWVAKQMNLKAFLASAYGPLNAAQIGIDVVGDIPPRLAKEVQQRYPRVLVHGRVDSVDQHLKRARIGIIAEEIGGGFKLKSLDYVFGRVPIVALAGSIDGLPLTHGESVIVTDRRSGLAAQVVSVIDDFERLNRLHEAAFRACRHDFLWAQRGVTLRDALSRVSQG